MYTNIIYFFWLKNSNEFNFMKNILFKYISRIIFDILNIYIYKFIKY